MIDTKNVNLRDVQQLQDGISVAMEALRRIQVTLGDPGLRSFPSFALDPFGVTNGALDHTGYRAINPLAWPYSATYGYPVNGYNSFNYGIPGSTLGYRPLGYDPRGGMAHSPWNPVYGNMYGSMVSPLANAYGPISYVPFRSF